uniref:Uncharacterized protein n=1 Tax=Peronospora matthiolae TaxID=2874970 RepID=A0AAV1V6M4_9STRA
MDVTAYKAPQWFEKSRQRQVREVPDSISGKAQPLVQSAEHEDVKSEDRDKFKSKLFAVREEASTPNKIDGRNGLQSTAMLVQSGVEYEDVKSPGWCGLVV